MVIARLCGQKVCLAGAAAETEPQWRHPGVGMGSRHRRVGWDRPRAGEGVRFSRLRSRSGRTQRGGDLDTPPRAGGGPRRPGEDHAGRSQSPRRGGGDGRRAERSAARRRRSGQQWGHLFEGEFARASLDDCLRFLQINVVALTALTRLFLPPMLQRGAGRILNVASTAAFVPVPQLSAYAAAKAYVLSLTELISEGLRETGVAATALSPGFTDTAMMRGSALARPIPPAMMMSPKEVAELGCAASRGRRSSCRVSPTRPSRAALR